MIYYDLSQSWAYLENVAEQVKVSLTVDLFIAGILNEKNVQQNHTPVNSLAKHLCLHLYLHSVLVPTVSLCRLARTSK